MHIDFELLKNCVNNDRRAQKQLYEYCYKVFIPLCLRYNTNEEDARAAFNNSFLKILTGLEKVELKEINFFAWSKRIITNVLIDEYRKMRTHQTYYTSKETDRELEIHSENIQNDAESDFGYNAILNMIEEIPESHALVFKLYVFENYSHKEISEQLGLSEGTSKWHLSTARKLLREKIEKMDAVASKKMVI